MLAAKAVEELSHVAWEWGGPVEAASGGGMVECESGGVQGRAREVGAVGIGSAMQGAIVNALAAQGSAGLAEVDANLVGASGFEAAFDEAVGAEILDEQDVSDGVLAFLGGGAGTAATVASVADEAGFDACGNGATPDDGLIDAFDRVGAKLSAEIGLGLGSAGEDEQAGGVAIEAMDGAYRDRLALGMRGEQIGEEVSECVR